MRIADVSPAVAGIARETVSSRAATDERRRAVGGRTGPPGSITKLIVVAVRTRQSHVQCHFEIVCLSAVLDAGLSESDGGPASRADTSAAEQQAGRAPEAVYFCCGSFPASDERAHEARSNRLCGGARGSAVCPPPPRLA